MTFSKVNLKDYLQQVATDIVTIFKKPHSYTSPSLETGDPVRNIMVTLVIQP